MFSPHVEHCIINYNYRNDDDDDDYFTNCLAKELTKLATDSTKSIHSSFIGAIILVDMYTHKMHWAVRKVRGSVLHTYTVTISEFVSVCCRH